MRHYFSRRRRSRSRRRASKSRKSRRRRRKSRRRKSTKRHRVGNNVILANGKKLKVQKDKDGWEFVRSGKKRTKSYVGKTGKVIKKPKKSRSKRRRRKSSSKRRRRRKFGRQPGLVSMMGDFRPLSQMNTFQQRTGMSGPQMSKHMAGVLKSDRANFYTSV